MAEIVEGGAVDPVGETLRSWGELWLDDRELGGYGAIDTDRSRWRQHIATAPFIDWPLRSITEADIYQWLDALKRKKAAKGFGHRKARQRKLGRTTVQNTLNLLRCCLEDARARIKIPSNPCNAVKIGRRREAETHEPWTYLLQEEQRKLLTCDKIPEDARLLIAFALGTGMRESEVWNLHLADVHLERRLVVVRYGSHHRARAGQRGPKKDAKNAGPTKGGKPRHVPLFGLAKEALVRWLEILPSRPNRFGLVWPSPRGYRRQPHAPRDWEDWLKKAEIVAEQRHDQMPVRWHDLRHTCAASLVSGWWGRLWRLEEIQGLLGHSDISVTQRYAHLADDALKKAAQETDQARKDALRALVTGDDALRAAAEETDRARHHAERSDTNGGSEGLFVIPR
jgi:integrase